MFRVFLLLGIVVSIPASMAGQLEVGVGVVDITPYDLFEEYPEDHGKPGYKWLDPFYDTGVDKLFDFEEMGAFGPDMKPGKAGVDDDKDGIIDNCDRTRCKEYRARGSDDVKDPNGDNFNLFTNPKGTENNWKFEKVYVGGYGPYFIPFIEARWASGIQSKIWARALAVKGDNGELVVLVSTDLPGLAWKNIDPVRRKLERVFGIPRTRIVISSNHIHSAPDGAGYWSMFIGNHSKPYTDLLRDWIYEAAAQALNNMKPAKMKAVTTNHVACYNPETREVKRDPDCNIPDFEYQYKEPNHGYDEWIMQSDRRDPIVRNTKIVAAQFVSAKTDETIATFINWHNHPEVLDGKNTKISADFIHYIRDFVEHHLGGKAVYFTGSVGCQIGQTRTIKVPWWTANREKVYQDVTDIHGNRVPKWSTVLGVQKIRSIGYEIGHEVVQALDAAQYQDSVPVSIITEPQDYPVTNIIHVVGTGPVWSFDVEPADRMIRYRGRCSGWLGCARVDMSLIQFGNLSMITAPGELDPIYVYGRKETTGIYPVKPKELTFPALMGFEQFMPGEHHAILGLAQHYLSYQVHIADNVGIFNDKHPVHYEEQVTIGEHFGDDWGNKAMQMLGSSYRYNDREILPGLANGKILAQYELIDRKPKFKSPFSLGGDVLKALLAFGNPENRQ